MIGKEEYSLERINRPGSNIVSCYVFVDKYGNHRSDGGIMAIRVDNHFVVKGEYSMDRGHEIEGVYDGDVAFEVVDKKVRDLMKEKLERILEADDNAQSLYIGD